MEDLGNLFEKALDQSNAEQLQEAANDLYRVYQILQKAGFDKQSALTLMIGLIQSGLGPKAGQK